MAKGTISLKTIIIVIMNECKKALSPFRLYIEKIYKKFMIRNEKKLIQKLSLREHKKRMEYEQNNTGISFFYVYFGENRFLQYCKSIKASNI